MGRFPVTFYKEQWLRILASAPGIEAHIGRHHDRYRRTRGLDRLQLRVLLFQFFQPLRLVYLQPPYSFASGSTSVPRSPLPCMLALSSRRSPRLLRSVAAGSLPAPVDTSCLVPFQAPLMPVSYFLHWHKSRRALQDSVWLTMVHCQQSLPSCLAHSQALPTCQNDGALCSAFTQDFGNAAYMNYRAPMNPDEFGRI